MDVGYSRGARLPLAYRAITVTRAMRSSTAAAFRWARPGQSVCQTTPKNLVSWPEKLRAVSS
jgi:hypothetical protein